MLDRALARVEGEDDAREARGADTPLAILWRSQRDDHTPASSVAHIAPSTVIHRCRERVLTAADLPSGLRVFCAARGPVRRSTRHRACPARDVELGGLRLSCARAVLALELEKSMEMLVK